MATERPTPSPLDPSGPFANGPFARDAADASGASDRPVDATHEPADEPADDAVGERADGRHLRRERNRAAVVEALLGLYRAGNLNPSTDEIAERAGLSPRSLFRYFDDVDDLCRVAIQHQEQRIVSLIGEDLDHSLPVAERAAMFAAQRVRLFDAMSYVGVVARLRAPFQPIIAGELALARSFLRHQIERDFRPELAELGARRATALAAADVVCSFESYQLLTSDQSLSPTEAADVLADALVRLVAGAPAAAEPSA